MEDPLGSFTTRARRALREAVQQEEARLEEERRLLEEARLEELRRKQEEHRRVQEALQRCPARARWASPGTSAAAAGGARAARTSCLTSS